jgi:hypothetical protein
MQFNMFVYLISLLVAIQGAKLQVTLDPVSCTPYIVTVEAALREMVEIANTAYTCTQSLYNP